jgi:hypothetical protein
MIARSAQTAATALLAATLLGLALPQAALARDHGRDSSSYGQQYSDHRGRDYDDNGGPRYASPRHHGWGHHHNYYRYAPSYYPDVVVYPEPRVYYSAPYYAEPVYPREYGTVGIHLDYNLLY